MTGTAQEEARCGAGMFDRIAGVYDLMNSAMTAGLHHRCASAPPTAPSNAGDLGARRLLRHR